MTNCPCSLGEVAKAHQHRGLLFLLFCFFPRGLDFNTPSHPGDQSPWVHMRVGSWQRKRPSKAMTWKGQHSQCNRLEKKKKIPLTQRDYNKVYIGLISEQNTEKSLI